MTRISRAGIHWTLRIVAIVAAFGLAGMNPSGRAPEPGEMFGCIGCADGPIGQDNCCDQCHTTYNGSGYAGSVHSSPCRQGTCSSTHSSCEADELPELSQLDLVETVNVAVDGQDANELARLLSAAPRRVAVNDARQAIQLMDCAGEVVANFPAPSAVLSAVAAVNAAQH